MRSVSNLPPPANADSAAAPLRAAQPGAGPRAPGGAQSDGAAAPLRPWQRLGVRLAALFAAVTVLAVGVVGAWIYDRQRREVEDTVGIQLLNIARVGALLVDPALAMSARRAPEGEAVAPLRRALSAMQQEVLLTTPVLLL